MKPAWRLLFNDLRNANRQRLPLFKNSAGGVAHSQPDGSDWNLAEWTNAIAGEVGEACNLSKKIIRGDFGPPGTAQYDTARLELAKEIADVVIYADIACMQCGYMLSDVVKEKFNEVSRRVDCDVVL